MHPLFYTAAKAAIFLAVKVAYEIWINRDKAALRKELLQQRKIK